MVAYSQKKDYSKAVVTAEKIKHIPQFNYSRCHVLYANGLAQIGLVEKAETEFTKMNGKFSHYEGRYQYALFLVREQRKEEAYQLLSDIVAESKHLSSYERRNYRVWIMKAREELKKLQTVSA